MKRFITKKYEQIPRSVMSEIEVLLDKDKEILSLSIGEPDFKTPYLIREEAIYNINKGNTFYSEILGFKKLRSEISIYLENRFNLKYGTDEILITNGSSEAIDVTFRALIDEGDEVVIVEPSYVSYEPLLTMLKANIKRIVCKEEDGFRLTKKALEEVVSKNTKILVINFPNNPSGAIMTKQDYDEIASIIKENDILVIADEIYAELTYEKNHYSVANNEMIKNNVILISGFSKAFAMTGWRLGYLCADLELIKAINLIHSYSAISANSISQFAGIAAVKYCQNEVYKMKNEFERRRNYLVESLNEIGLSTHYPEGAFYVFPNVSCLGIDGLEFAKRLAKEENLLVVPGEFYGKPFKNYIRISYAYSIEEIKEGLVRIKRMLEKIKQL